MKTLMIKQRISLHLNINSLKFIILTLVLLSFSQFGVHVFAQGGLIDINEKMTRTKRDTFSIYPEKQDRYYQNEEREIRSYFYNNRNISSTDVNKNIILRKKFYDFQKKFYSDRIKLLSNKSFTVDTTILQVSNKLGLKQKDGKKSESAVTLFASEKLDDIQKKKVLLDSIIFEMKIALKDTSSLIESEKFPKQSNQADTLLKQIQIDFNKIDRMQATNKVEVTEEIQGIPALTSPLIAGYVVPSASVVASRIVSDHSSGTVWQVNLFFAGNTNQDTTSVQSFNKQVPVTKLLIPEISNFGLKVQATKALSLDFVEGGNPQSKYVGLIGQLNFLSKNISNADSTDLGNPNINTFFIHGKAGAEIAIVPEAITVYGLYNGIYSVTQVENFENFYQKTNRIYLCIETGILAQLHLPGDDKNDLIFDLSLIFKNKQLHSLSNDKDVLIPSIRVGYKARLSK